MCRFAAAAGYRVIVPYLRGYGTTRFLSGETFRNGQPSAVAVRYRRSHGRSQNREGDPRRFSIGGARTANIIAALWPERCKAMVSVSGYLIGNQESGKMPLPPKAELEWCTNIILPPNAAGRLRQIPPRLCAAHLAACFAEVELRRGDVRSVVQHPSTIRITSAS